MRVAITRCDGKKRVMDSAWAAVRITGAKLRLMRTYTQPLFCFSLVTAEGDMSRAP